MNPEEAFPLRFWINLGRMEDRRALMEVRLEEAGISAERIMAADVRRSRATKETAVAPSSDATPGDAPDNGGCFRGYVSGKEYARALSLRLALREARRRRAPAVLLLADDVVFQPNFRALARSVELPEDWGIFYLGCTHVLEPKWHGARVVRVRRSSGAYAIAIRAEHYERAMATLDRHRRTGPEGAASIDQVLVELQEGVSAYACYPNLAWEDAPKVVPDEAPRPRYTSDGRQCRHREAVGRLLGQAVGSAEPGSGEVRLGLLFLTRGDVNHPGIWREFVDEAPEQVRIFSHPKFPGLLGGGFLEGTAIAEHYETEWGCISLVRASRAMLLSALEDEEITHFVLLSESCVPVKPLPEILRSLELDPRPRFGFHLPRPGRQDKWRTAPIPQVPAGCWRFMPQWWLMDRAAAVFSTGQDYTTLFEKLHVPDESYFATVLSMQGFPLEGDVVRNPVTWTWWEKGEGSPKAWPELPREQLENLLHSGALFARKFPVGADIGEYGLHRSPQARAHPVPAG